MVVILSKISCKVFNYFDKIVNCNYFRGFFFKSGCFFLFFIWVVMFLVKMNFSLDIVKI